MFALYFISKQLTTALRNAVIEMHKVEIHAVNVSGYDDVKDVLLLPSEIKMKVFPDELIKPFALIRLNEETTEAMLTFPEESKLSFPQKSQLGGMWESAGVSGTFKLPYVGVRNG